MVFFVDKEKITTEDRPSNTFKLRKGGKLFSLQCYSDKSDFVNLKMFRAFNKDVLYYGLIDSNVSSY